MNENRPETENTTAIATETAVVENATPELHDETATAVEPLVKPKRKRKEKAYAIEELMDKKPEKLDKDEAVALIKKLKEEINCLKQKNTCYQNTCDKLFAEQRLARQTIDRLNQTAIRQKTMLKDNIRVFNTNMNMILEG